MNTTSRILGEATRPPTEMELTDPEYAYYYAANIIKRQFPEGEAVIAMDRLDKTMNTTSRILGEATRPPTEMELTDPSCAYFYAKNTIKGPFPEGEAVIATDPYWAYNYALQVIKGRFQEGEEAIAKDTKYSKKYLEAFPDAKIDWYAREWIDWTQL